MSHTMEANSSKPTVVLLTAQFPYGNGETFLESEILHNTCPTLIFSYGPPGNDTIRPLPGNCRSYLINEKARSVFEKRLSKISNMCCLTALSELWQMLISGKMCRTTRRALYAFIDDGRRMFRFALKTLEKADTGREQRLIFYAYWMHSYAYAALLLQRYYPNSVVVSRCHRYDLYQEHAKFGYIPMRELLASKINHFYPIANDGKRYLENHHGVEEARITLARLGTNDLGVATPCARSVLRIVSCSRLIPLKRVPLIIDALALIDDIPVRWEHFGTGKTKYLSMLQSRADEQFTKLPNIQYEFKGFMPNFEFLTYCKDNPFHIFANVSESEGVPVSIMEAFSLGTPVVATAVGGTSEIVSNGENGLLLPESVTPNEIADAFRRFYEMPDNEYEDYRESARKTWQSMCDASQVYPAFYEHLSHHFS